MLLVSTCVLCGGLGAGVCPRCAATLAPAPAMPHPLGLDACVAMLDYREASALLTALKNGGRRDLVGWLADGLAPRLRPSSEAVVTWAPTGAARRRSRGFDQAELLARALARRWGRPCRPLLRRRPGPAQAGRSAAERRANPSFAAIGSSPPAVVVVDDIATTGATLVAAARALRRAGATEVTGVVGARAAGPGAA